MKNLVYLWYDVLDFIFGTKVGHIVFSVAIVMGIVGLLSIFIEYIDFEVLIGAAIGALITTTYLAIRDKSLKWI